MLTPWETFPPHPPSACKDTALSQLSLIQVCRGEWSRTAVLSLCWKHVWLGENVIPCSTCTKENLFPATNEGVGAPQLKKSDHVNSDVHLYSFTNMFPTCHVLRISLLPPLHTLLTQLLLSPIASSRDICIEPWVVTAEHTVWPI